MSKAKEYIAKVFRLACELGAAHGWENISLQPGCQELQIDDEWWMAINPHGEPTQCSTGGKIPPHAVYFRYNGFPAGILASDGGLIAHGTMANETKLILALKKAIEATGAPPWDEETA